MLGRLLSGCVSHVKLLVAAAQGSSKRRAVGFSGPAVVSSKLSSKYGMPVPCTHGLKYGMQLPRNAAILHSVQSFKYRVTMQETHCAANCLPFNVGSSNKLLFHMLLACYAALMLSIAACLFLVATMQGSSKRPYLSLTCQQHGCCVLQALFAVRFGRPATQGHAF